MMDEKVETWIRELRRFNRRLHLMGPAMLDTIEGELGVLMPLLQRIREPRIADLGSGSGLPAIPYKILHPDSGLSMIERSARKCEFLQRVVDLLDLRDVEIIRKDPFHDPVGTFDAVLCRSFSPLSTLDAISRKILAEKGRLYYLYTGETPCLSQGFRLKQTLTEETGGFRLNLALFSRLPC